MTSKFNKFSNSTNTQSNAEPLGHLTKGLTECINSITGYLTTKEIEKTKRTDIQARRDIAIESIKAQKELLLNLTNKVFDERQSTIQNSFILLDKAIDSKNNEIIDKMLGVILTTIQKNPIEQIQSLNNTLTDNNSVLKLE